MKYYSELSKEDQERALRKLMFKPVVKHTCLLRANVPVLADGQEVEYKPASVVKIYFNTNSDNELLCDVVFDTDQSTISKGYFLDNLSPTDIEEPTTQQISAHDIETNKKALEQLLTSGKVYMFDQNCNAYPV